MSNTNKYFADLIKVCSVLPVFAVMPAMAIDYTSGDIEKYPYTVKAGDSLLVTEGYSNAKNGVFHNGGSLTISDGLNFVNNNTEGYGGTIYIFDKNSTSTIIGSNVVFSGGNAMYGTEAYAGMGGAIYSWSDGTAEGQNVIEMGDNVVFEDLAAVDGSVMYTYGYNTITIGDNLVVEDNHSPEGYGAFVINGYDAITHKDFINTLKIGKNALFEDNVALLRAGAVYVGGDANDKAIFDDGARFIENVSSFGGAVAGFGAFEFGDVLFDSNISFNAYEHFIKGWGWEGSYAREVGNGGAVANAGDFVIEGDASFTNNIAEGLGGAIYNSGDMVFQGDIVFSGNKDNVTITVIEDNKKPNGFELGDMTGGTPNDIYNDGTLTIASGTTSFDGGITGTGTLDIKSGATLNMNYASIEQGSINIDGTLVASLLNANDALDITGGLSGEGRIDLNVGSTGVYDLSAFSDFIDMDSFGKTYNVSVEDGIATLTAKQAAEIAKETGITGGAAGAVSAFASSSDANLQKVSMAIQEALNTGNTALVEKEMAKVNPDSKPVGHSVASSVQGQVVAVAAGRMSAVGGGAMGRSGGDVTSAGFWAQGLVNKSKMGSAFQGSTTGFALGGDMLVDNVLTLGGGFAFNSTEIEADGRDTDVESNSVFAYAQYKPSKWFVNGTVSYTLSDYTDDARVFGGDVINNQYDTKAFGAQAIFGYDFASGVSPEVGLRYLYVSQEEHVDGLNRVIKEMNSDVLTGIAGLKYAFAIESDTAVKFSPSLRAAMTYDFVTPDSVATIVVPGTAPYYVDIDSLSRMGGEFGIGLTAEYRGLELSLNYELDLHKDYTSQTGLFKFRYNF